MRKKKSDLNKYSLEEIMEPYSHYTAGEVYTDKRLPKYLYVVAEDEFGKYFRVFAQKDRGYSYEEIGYEELDARDLKKIDYRIVNYREEIMLVEDGIEIDKKLEE